MADVGERTFEEVTKNRISKYYYALVGNEIIASSMIFNLILSN